MSNASARNGRPLRFLAVTLGGWIALRVAILWPTIDGVPALLHAVAPPLAAATRPPVSGRAVAVPVSIPVKSPVRDLAATRPRIGPPSQPLDRTVDPLPVASAAAVVPVGGEQVSPPTIPPPLRPAPMAPPGGPRLAGSIWLLARGGANGTLTGGQLGGSQAGVRLTYALGDSRRLALAGRIAAPLSGRGAEAAVGVEWRPTDAPIRLVAEQRFPLDGGRGGPTLMAIGGVGPTAIGGGFRLEAYAEGGAIARDGVEGFGDGAARVTRPVAALGRVHLDLGAGSWGAAQRGTRRVELGPTIGVQLPVTGRTLRLTLDWRQRLAGNARPGSGPALSLGSDF